MPGESEGVEFGTMMSFAYPVADSGKILGHIIFVWGCKNVLMKLNNDFKKRKNSNKNSFEKY